VSIEEEHLGCGINHSFVIGLFFDDAVSTSEYTLPNVRTDESEQI